MPGTEKRNCLGLLAGLSLSLLGACATIVEGSGQTVTVTTQPPGASCKLVREGATVAMVDPTPGSVEVDKDSVDILVLCEMEGHEPGAGTMSSSVEGMTFGNILFGGLIGVAIDAGSGAMHEYPSYISLVMPPKEFATESDRDEFYLQLINSVRIESAKAIAKIQEDCHPEREDQCEGAVDEVEQRREERIAELDAMRLRARILNQP